MQFLPWYFFLFSQDAVLRVSLLQIANPALHIFFQQEFYIIIILQEIGESGLDRLITACYRLLGLISFLTVGEDECRAWTIREGTKAPQAAGKIHTDFEKGFIRAEVVPYETLIEQGSMAACREKGLIRSEGKEYIMKDGDVTLFRFNV